METEQEKNPIIELVTFVAAGFALAAMAPMFYEMIKHCRPRGPPDWWSARQLRRKLLMKRRR